MSGTVSAPPHPRFLPRLGLHAVWRLHAGTPARAIVSLVSLAALLRSYVFVYRNFSPWAWFDYWLWVEDFRRWVEGRFTWHDLVKLHYGQHRLATARLFFLVDSLAFDMRGWSIAIANLVLLACTGLVLWRLVRRGNVAGTFWDLPPLVWVALMSAVCQVDNLITPFQIQFAISSLCATSAASLLASAAEARPALHSVWLAGAAGTVCIAAAFTMASGVLLPPALVLLLVLMWARPLIWAVWAPLAGLGAVLFFHHYPSATSQAPALLDGHWAWIRLRYVDNFLASSLNAFADAASWAGFASLVVVLTSVLGMARWRWVSRKPIPAGDAALLALAVFVALCGPAGTLTARLYFGPGAALVSRYATLGLLFDAALLGLALRWCARARALPAFFNIAVPMLPVALLCITNAPAYGPVGAGINTAIAADAGLLANNVGIEGPAPVLLGGTVDDIRADTAFLHAHRLNMFAAGTGLPPRILQRLDHIDPHALPACRGFVDSSYAIDSTGVLLRGWLTNPQGTASAPWVAALDDHGALLGAARALTDRPDVTESLGMRVPAYGFEVGFRAPAAPAPDVPRAVQLLGVFTGDVPPICALGMPAVIGSVLLEPAVELRDAASAGSGPPTLAGFTVWHATTQGPAGAIPGNVPAWGFVTGAAATMQFTLASAPAPGRALVLPFASSGEGPGRTAAFVMADGSRFQTDLPSLWARPAWRAAVLPPALLARHPGPVTIEVHAHGNAWLDIGAPLTATLRPEWSRLF